MPSSVTIFPLTVTSPAEIYSSASLREHTPELAINLLSLTAFGSSLICFLEEALEAAGFLEGAGLSDDLVYDLFGASPSSLLYLLSDAGLSDDLLYDLLGASPSSLLYLLSEAGLSDDLVYDLFGASPSSLLYLLSEAGLSDDLVYDLFGASPSSLLYFLSEVGLSDDLLYDLLGASPSSLLYLLSEVGLSDDLVYDLFGASPSSLLYLLSEAGLSLLLTAPVLELLPPEAGLDGLPPDESDLLGDLSVLLSSDSEERLLLSPPGDLVIRVRLARSTFCLLSICLKIEAQR